MRKLKYRYAYYSPDTKTVIGVEADCKPSSTTVPESGTWVIKELDGTDWRMPSYPEITWGVLRRMIYLGTSKNQ